MTNKTLGQLILPIGGWYSIPPKTAVSIKKIVRMPVLTHFFDDLNTVTYSLKKQDKSTTWKIDTDLMITRAIDTGNIQDVNNVTASISAAGLGIYQKTISR